MFYFNNKVSGIFEEKTDEGNKSLVLSSPYNFVAKDEIIARIIDVESEEDIKDHIDRKQAGSRTKL